jgi:hypothetical protein
LEYAIKSVQVKQDGLKLNYADQILVYVDDINILRGSVHTIQKNTEALIIASKQSGLGVNVDKTKYMIMSLDQIAGWSPNMKTDNSSFERVGQVGYIEYYFNKSKFHSGRN